MEIGKGSRTALAAPRYTVRVRTAPASDGLVDVLAVLLTGDRRVRNDDDLVFFNNPSRDGVALAGSGADVDLGGLPAEIERVVVALSTEAQGVVFSAVDGLEVDVDGGAEAFRFVPSGLGGETVLQAVAFYRRGGAWKLDAVGQGYDRGLAAFAADHGIDVEEPAPAPPSTVSAAAASPIDMRKVSVTLTKDSPDRTARIDLRKSRGEPGWVLTVGLEWDGRDAKYRKDGTVKKYGTGDLDVYFFCRDEETGRYVVISGEPGHRGSLSAWPHVEHGGDATAPGRGGLPAAERVRVLPHENGDLLVNVYQSVDNGSGALDTFGQPRLVVRYGRAGASGEPGADADEVVVHPGNGDDCYWATVAHIDVQDGVLTVDGETRYSEPGSETMPILDVKGNVVTESEHAPSGQSKSSNGLGLEAYEGRCPD